MEKYSQKHKEEMREYQRKYKEKHKEETAEYQRKYREKRKIKRPYGKLGGFLKDKLEELGKNQSWLARELGVSREIVSKYIKGVYFPREIGRGEELCRILNIKYSDLEKILNED